MEWINREDEFPCADKFLCFDGKDVFILELIESKWGNHYCSTDIRHNNKVGWLEWTHWMPLPESPKD